MLSEGDTNDGGGKIRSNIKSSWFSSDNVRQTEPASEQTVSSQTIEDMSNSWAAIGQCSPVLGCHWLILLSQKGNDRFPANTFKLLLQYSFLFSEKNAREQVIYVDGKYVETILCKL